MSDQTSMDFLGQKRRVRPVRKVQVSTHFDELNFDELNGGPSTPEPPGINAPVVNEAKTEPVTTDHVDHVSGPQSRQAVYASRIPSPPQMLNTLVPEDFDMIEFLKPRNNGKEEPLRTDDSFVLAEINEIEEHKASTEVVSAEEANMIVDEPDSNTGVVIAASSAAVVTTAALSNEKDIGNLPKKSVPVVAVASVYEESLKKVSEARKSIEASSLLLKETEIKAVPSPKVVEPEKKAEVHKEELVAKASPIVTSKVEEPVAPIFIAKQEDKKEPLRTESPNVLPMVTAAVPKQAVSEPVIAKVPTSVEEVKAPPPLPTNNEHLVAARESLKPSMSPVKPVNGAPTSDPNLPKSSSSPLAKPGINSEELEKLNKEIEMQKLALERETDSKKVLEIQINAMISKSTAQEEALRYKNESMDQLHTDFLRTKNDLTAVKTEKDRLEASLVKAQEELKATSDSNAQVYLQKSDEVSALKDKLAEFASIIGQKNKEIDSLQRQLEEAKRANMKTALDNVQQYEKIEDELLKIVEEEILRMQDTIDEQREYNSKMQVEVDSEYAYWKRRLSKSENETK